MEQFLVTPVRQRKIDVVGTAVAAGAGSLIILTSILHLCGLEVGDGPIRGILLSVSAMISLGVSYKSWFKR